MCGENDNTFSFTHPNCLDLMDPRSAWICGVMSPGPGQGAGRLLSLDAGCRWVWLPVKRLRMLVLQETSQLFHCQPDTLRFTHAVSKIFSLKRSCKIGKRALAAPVVLHLSSQHAGSFARAAQAQHLVYVEPQMLCFPGAGTGYGKGSCAARHPEPDCGDNMNCPVRAVCSAAKFRVLQQMAFDK